MAHRSSKSGSHRKVKLDHSKRKPKPHQRHKLSDRVIKAARDAAKSMKYMGKMKVRTKTSAARLAVEAENFLQRFPTTEDDRTQRLLRRSNAAAKTGASKGDAASRAKSSAKRKKAVKRKVAWEKSPDKAAYSNKGRAGGKARRLTRSKKGSSAARAASKGRLFSRYSGKLDRGRRKRPEAHLDLVTKTRKARIRAVTGRDKDQTTAVKKFQALALSYRNAQLDGAGNRFKKTEFETGFGKGSIGAGRNNYKFAFLNRELHQAGPASAKSGGASKKEVYNKGGGGEGRSSSAASAAKGYDADVDAGSDSNTAMDMDVPLVELPAVRKDKNDGYFYVLGQDAMFRTRVEDYNNCKSPGDSYVDLVAVIERSGMDESAIATDILIALSNDDSELDLSEYSDQLKLTASKFIGITQVAEEARMPGMAKLARAVFEAIADGEMTFRDAFTGEDPAFIPSYRKQSKQDKEYASHKVRGTYLIKDRPASDMVEEIADRMSSPSGSQVDSDDTGRSDIDLGGKLFRKVLNGDDIDVEEL